MTSFEQAIQTQPSQGPLSLLTVNILRPVLFILFFKILSISFHNVVSVHKHKYPVVLQKHHCQPTKERVIQLTQDFSVRHSPYSSYFHTHTRAHVLPYSATDRDQFDPSPCARLSGSSAFVAASPGLRRGGRDRMREGERERRPREISTVVLPHTH